MREIQLTHPLPDGAKSIESLKIRDGDEVVATDFMYQEIDGFEARSQALIASLTGLPEASVRKLRGKDYFAAQNAALAIIGEIMLENDNTPVEPAQTLTLKVPVPIGSSGRTISELKFRAHTLAEDYLGLDVDGGIARAIAMIASFTSNDVSIIRRISGSDFLAANKKTTAIIEADSAFDAPPENDDTEDADPKKQ